MQRNKTYRIRTDVNGESTSVHFNIDNSVENYELLSLSISQTNAYRLMASGKGVVAGRVLANNGFGVPNAKVSVFIPYDGDENLYDSVLYNFSTARSLDYNGIRYNLLPNGSDDVCHQTVGTFPRKRVMLDDDNWVEVFEKYYLFTTKTNAAGDYMIYGVPVGMQNLHMDVDLSDIGPLSQRPRDMMAEGYNPDMFENPNKFKSGTNLNSLVQIKSDDAAVYVYPFWGDTTDSTTNATITRHDFSVNYTFKPTCVFMGSVISDTGENSMSKKCVGSKKQGKMSEMMTGEGKIEMIRKTFDGNTEEFSVKGNQLINGDGVWCYQIPMNLDYVVTDEYGNTVLSDNPEKGIPTRARVRFRVSMSESPDDATARKRARYLIPNNPHLIEEDYPYFTKTKEVDYEFGSKTKDENFRDLMWNNVYTVKSYIPRIQKSNLPNNLRHIGIKAVNHPGSHNPMPFNNLRIKMNFSYMFMCALVKVFVYMVLGLNTVLTAVSYALFKIAQAFIAMTMGGWFNNGVLSILGSFYGKQKGNQDTMKYRLLKYYRNRTDNLYASELKGNIESESASDDDDGDGTNNNIYQAPKIYRATVFMLSIISEIAKQQPDNSPLSKFKYIMNEIGTENPTTTYNSIPIGVKGFSAILLAVVYIIGCGIELNGLCEKDDGEEISVTPGTLDYIKNIFAQCTLWFGMGDKNCNDNVAELFNCIENELAQDNEVTTFNFYNDWINGVLYFPLWYRKIKPKRKFLGINIKAKDQWCSADASWIKSHADKRQIKVYETCALKRNVVPSSGTMGEELSPLDDGYYTMDIQKSMANDDTGIERTVFSDYKESNCYGYECHRRTRSYVPMTGGLMKEKETMLGDLVYYYKPCNYDQKYTKDLVTLFATDIVLLGSLSDCDIHGVPQFFKALESTTYNMPPDLMSEVYEYKESVQDIYTDENNNAFIDESTRMTEYTGADWGDLGADQSHYTSNSSIWDTNENIYDNGGLFYGITCFNSFTKPKSCINLSRICEFGVSLDESQEIVSTSAIESSGVSQLSEDMYQTLTPDGFVSYDEIYNPDYRSMFATMNSNFLRTKLNYKSGLYEYDFNHLYMDNFDGSMSVLMGSPSVTGQKLTPGGGQPNYIGNRNLEKSSDAYLNFRYGDYPKKNIGGNKLYFYDYNKNIAKVGPVGKKNVINAKDRIPRYENSLYFYFGLNEGKTAIDSFYTSYYSPCANDDVFQPNYEINGYANSVCPAGTLDGCVTFNLNFEPDFSLVIKSNDNDVEYYADNISSQTFYIGYAQQDVNMNGYKHVALYNRANGNEVDFIQNGEYSIKITDTDGNVVSETLELLPPKISYDLSVTDFSCKNVDLDNTFTVLNQYGEYDWHVMFPTIANYKTIANEDIVNDGNVNRLICGYVKVRVDDMENFKMTLEPASPSFFMDANENFMYAAPEVVVIGNGSSITSDGDGYLGNDGTDYYFGVPYGEQKYTLKITQLCGYGEETDNIVSETFIVHEGNFKMYINGVDYEMIQSFRTGWTGERLTGDTETMTFNPDDMYGWNNVDNIGCYYDNNSNSVVPIQLLDCTADTEDIIKVGDVLSDDYDGNGASYIINGTDCSNPYSWSTGYCLSSETLNQFKAKANSPITAIYTDGTSRDGTVITDITSAVAYDSENGMYRAVYYKLPALGEFENICTEYMSDDGSANYIEYEEGYSKLSGLNLFDIYQIVSNINNIINNREEFVRTIKGAFRIGASETTLSVTYSSASTPIRFLIAGTRDTTYSSGYRTGGLNTITNTIGNNRIVFDRDFGTNEITFKYPTITYDSHDSQYEPYTITEHALSIGTVEYEKIPYYIAIQNNLGISVPITSSRINVLSPSSSDVIIDNFNTDVIGTNPINPYINAMFGVHFYNNAMYYKQLRLVNLFNSMVKYGSDIESGHNFVICNALVIARAVNGISPHASLDHTNGMINTASVQVGDHFRASDNERLLYDNSNMYGSYNSQRPWVDDNGDTITIDAQYFTLSRNRTLTIYDGYGPDYEDVIVCDYAFDTSQITLANPNSQFINIPLSITRTMPNDTVYHIFRYVQGNHPLDYAVWDDSTSEWRFQDKSHTDNLNELFTVGHNFTSEDGYIETTSLSSYQYTPDQQYGANQLFLVGESKTNGVLVFSPVIECAHIMCLKNLSSQHSSGYDLYFLRRPTTENDTSNLDIDDFYYILNYPFTISFKVSSRSEATPETVLSYTVDPNDASMCEKNVQVTHNAGTATLTGKALKVSFENYASDFNENGLSSYSVWITDVIGVERLCSGYGLSTLNYGI